jgi:hypothetical protein
MTSMEAAVAGALEGRVIIGVLPATAVFKMRLY